MQLNGLFVVVFVRMCLCCSICCCWWCIYFISFSTPNFKNRSIGTIDNISIFWFYVWFYSDRQRHDCIHNHIQVQVVDRILWMFDLIWFGFFCGGGGGWFGGFVCVGENK